MLSARALPTALLCLAALAGCRSSLSLDPPRTPELVAAEPLPITLSNKLGGWKVTSRSLGKRTRIRLGPLLKELFPATDGRYFLSAVDASMRDESDATGVRTSTLTFRLALQIDGETHMIEAHGYGRSLDPLEADRSAIESCVGSIYVQAAEVLGERE